MSLIKIKMIRGGPFVSKLSDNLNIKILALVCRIIYFILVSSYLGYERHFGLAPQAKNPLCVCEFWWGLIRPPSEGK